MTFLSKIFISWNVFSLYFTKNSLNNNNTDRADYNFSNSLFIIINASHVIFITDYFSIGYWKVIFAVLTGFHLLIGILYERKVKQGVAKFRQLGFSKFYVFFIIYLITGLTFLTWMLFTPKDFFKG